MRFLRPCLTVSLSFLLAFVLPGLAGSSPKPKAEAGEKKGAGPASLSQIDIPHYAPPEAYREELVIHTDGKEMTMKRFVDHGKMRTEMNADGHDFVMIEMGDEKGTVYTIMPEQKTAMKQSARAMAKTPDPKSEGAGTNLPPDLKVENLGEETLGGVTAKKLRMSVGKEGTVVGWFDKATGAPLRMESKEATMEWKDRKSGPQSDELFAVPKGYEVQDMDEMMKKMGGMGGMGAMGGIGGMAKGYAGGMAQGVASNMGGSLGASLGGALGGPLGSIAGRFIGGKVGGMIGKKAVNAIN